MEKHRIQISSDLYNDIYNYCKANGLKLNEFCEKLLKSLFLQEKYGDIPYGEIISDNIPKQSQDNCLNKTVEDFYGKLIDVEKSNEQMYEIVENCGGPEEYNNIVNELIFEKNIDKIGDLENLTEKKPKKRRLK